MNRRSFLRRSALAAATVSFSARSWSQVAGANETIRAAVVGFNQRGGSHISSLRGLQRRGDKVKIVALCDVDSTVLDKRAKEFTGENSVQTFSDIRRLLDMRGLDVVTIATPNHWHSLAAIWSIMAGKDVYVEKPVSHNVWEGRQLVKAARKYNKIVQTGTQIRSSEGIREAVKWVQAGNLGKILVARGLCYKRRATIGKVDGPTPIPDYIDYDLWCGPAPKVPLMRKKLHYDWHWVWDTGNGDLGNQGIHQMDIARWFLGVDALSPRVFSVGGRLGYVDDGQTANTQIVYHDYPTAPLIFEVRGLPERSGSEKMDNYHGAGVGDLIECEGGHILVPDYNKAIAFDKDGKEIRRFSSSGGEDNHFGNFIKAVRSRKHTELNADVLEGHLSSALCHTGNISYRLGKQESQSSIKEKIKNDRDAVATIERMNQHLGANGVDLDKTKLTMGVFLKMNPKTERFTNHSGANKMLTRDYRKPFGR